MNRLVPYIAPLLGDSRLDKITGGFQARDPGVDTGQIVIGLAVLTTTIVALWFVSRAMERRAKGGHFDSSLRLFLSLAKAHDLNWSDRWLLWRLAGCHQLKEPARLFLEPERFDAASLPDSLRLKRNQLDVIAKQIFAEKDQDHGSTAPGSQATEESPAPIPERPCPLSFPIDDNPALDVPLWPSDTAPPDDFSIASLFEDPA